MNKLGAVIRFTYRNNVKRKSFLVSTLILALILSALIHLPALIDRFSSDGGPEKIGFVGEETDIVHHMREYLTEQAGAGVELVRVASEDEAKQLVEEKRLSGYLLATEEANDNGIPVFQYKSKDAIPSEIDDLHQALEFANQAIARKSVALTDEQAAKLFAPVQILPVQLTSAAEGKSESEIRLAFVLVYVLLFLLYIGVIAFGNSVATEITAEKSSRVMELLVSSVSPLTQMFGKIIGICLVGLTQNAVIVATGLLNLTLSKNNAFLSSLNLSLEDIDPGLIGYFFVFYFLGYFIYATVFAATGSLVSRSEEVAQAIAPVTFLIVAVFILAMYGLSHPNVPFIVVMSYVPFFSPMLMFLRIGMSDPAPWEIALSIALSVAGIFAMGWLAAKIYRAGVLMYGKRPSWKELYKAMKAYDV